jgi:hypothetical protein
MGARSMQMPWSLRLGKRRFTHGRSWTPFFTGHPHRYGDARGPMRKILGSEVGAQLKPIWGLDAEGEIQGVWRDIGVPRVWCMMGKSFSSRKGNDDLSPRRPAGNFALCRFHSKHIALREFIRIFHTWAVFTRVWLTMLRGNYYFQKLKQ